MDEERNDEVGISLNDRCKEMIEEYIEEKYKYYSRYYKNEIRHRITILVEKCIYSDNHD